MAVKVIDANGKSIKIAGRGVPGQDGPAGKSAYQYALDGGYTGTEAEFQALLGAGPWLSSGFTPVTCSTNDQIEVALDNGYRAVGGRSFGFFVLNINAQGLTFSGGMRYFFVFNVSQSFGSILSQSYVKHNDDMMMCSVYDGVRGPWRTVLTKLDGTTKYPSNKNLLDNWYLLDPINQRGIASNVDLPDGYSLDRWVLSNTTVGTGRVKWVKGQGFVIPRAEVNYHVIDQRLEPSMLTDGTPTTVSIFYTKNGVNKVLSKTVRWNIENDFAADNGIEVYLTHTSTLVLFRVVYRLPSESFVLKACKMEVGTEQTLARKDANGNWVLNDPPPNKTLELLKCQKYQFFGPTVGLFLVMTGGAPRILIPTPVPLRTTPTLVGTPQVYAVNPIGQPMTGISFTAPSARNNGVLLTLTGATVPAWVSFNSGSGLDANL